MEDIDSKELLNLWKKGKTLYASLFKYTDESLHKAFNQSRDDLKNQTKTISEKYPNGAQSITDGVEALSKTFAKYQGIGSAENELKRNLLNKIITEKLIGIGFESPIKTTSQPQLIPIHIWPQKITDFDWNDSSFSINGVEFLKIRIIENIEIENHTNDQLNKDQYTLPDIDLSEKGPGRPSHETKIAKAYRSLKDGGKIDFSLPFSRHTDAIRDTVIKNHPELKDGKGLGDEVIRIYAKPLFDEDQASRKSS